MDQIHVVLGWVAVAAAGVALGIGVAVALRARRSLFAIDRAILIVVGSVLVASLVGLALPLGGGQLTDPLHLVYAAVALVALPLARYFGRSKDARLLGAYVAVGSLIVLAAMLRLFMTGR